MSELPSDVNRLADAGAVAKECDEVEAKLARLRASYEQYFLGIERQAPQKEHAALKKRMHQLRTSVVRLTASRFRVNNLQNKLLSYEQMWSRTIGEMENGTYHRDLYKARLHRKKLEPAPPQKAAPPAEAKPASARPVGPASGQISDAKLKAIYDAFVIAKKHCHEDVSKLTFDTMAATLRKQVPELLKQHNARSVEFKVVIRDGKAVLRAVPK